MKCNHNHFKIDIDHNYQLINVPSVSKVVSFIFGDSYYDSIPKQILEQAQIRGTCFHDGIEAYLKNKLFICNHDDVNSRHKNNLKFGINEWDKTGGTLCESEGIGIYIYENEPLFSGSWDLLFTDKKTGENILVDFKTSSNKHDDQWETQLNLYKMILDNEK